MQRHHERRSLSGAEVLFAICCLAGFCWPRPASGAETNEPQHVSLGLQFGAREACGVTQFAAGPRGVCVLGARPLGAVDRAGIRAGDVLQRLDDTAIETAADLLERVAALRVGDSVRAVVLRQHEVLTLSMVLTPADRAVPSGPAQHFSAATQPRLPFEILPLPAETRSIAGKVRNVDTAIWIEGEVLSIVHRDKRETLHIGGTFQLPMTRIPATDLWLLQMRKRDWDRAFFSYWFISAQAWPGAHGNFRGPNAVALPFSQRKLRGRLIERTLHSARLGENRKITVYLPPAVSGEDMRVLFMADGQSTERFVRVLEPLIAAGRVAPFAVVGVHASLSAWDTSKPFEPVRDLRSREYLLGVAPEEFANHMAFFVEEVLPWAAREYVLSTAREDRAISGFSSGGAFATAVAVRHPELFADALPFSICSAQVPAKPAGALPRFHFAAGELEPDCAAATRTVHELVRSWGATASLESYASGHDTLMWQVALARAMPEVFPVATK